MNSVEDQHENNVAEENSCEKRDNGQGKEVESSRPDCTETPLQSEGSEDSGDQRDDAASGQKDLKVKESGQTKRAEDQGDVDTAEEEEDDDEEVPAAKKLKTAD